MQQIYVMKATLGCRAIHKVGKVKIVEETIFNKSFAVISSTKNFK